MLCQTQNENFLLILLNIFIQRCRLLGIITKKCICPPAPLYTRNGRAAFFGVPDWIRTSGT